MQLRWLFANFSTTSDSWCPPGPTVFAEINTVCHVMWNNDNNNVLRVISPFEHVAYYLKT